MRKRGRGLLFALMLAPLPVAGLLAASQQDRGFPHVKHQRVFPICEGCHEGIVTGNATDVFPDKTDCERCHDGTREERVAWVPRGEVARASNLRFSHARHRITTDSAGESVTCRTCHAAEGAEDRMNVAGPQPQLCVSCHDNSEKTHLAAGAKCSECHLSLTSARALPEARISAFPKPSWHQTPDFKSTHGRDEMHSATCATCHARQTCERCHANAERVPLIASLGRDGRVAALEAGKQAEYPEPASHDESNWAATHGATARESSQSCANCHTRPSCTGCHSGGAGAARAVIASLPTPVRGGAQGVSPAQIAAVVHPSDIARRHGSLAATGSLDCAQCHGREKCSECHAGSDSRAFHAANFVERHAVDVFAQAGDCQSCHNTERFCRDCHSRVGVASNGRMNAAFHTGKATWVLSHGQAARSGMESCASCHRQNDCVRCHSAAGGWRVNPHGPGFAASRLAARNAASCRWCHTVLPAGS